MKPVFIDKELQQRIEHLSLSQKESLLRLIDSFTEVNDFDIAAYNNELEEANREIEKGNFVTHEEALQLING